MARPRKRRQRGTGELNQLRSGAWQIRWTENGRRRSKTFVTRDDAERVLAKVQGQIAQGRTGLPPDPRGLPTLGDVAPGLLERRKLTHRSADCDRYRWRKHLAPHFAHLKPPAVDVACIRAFIEAQLARKVNPASVKIHVSLLSSLFVDLVERGLVASNPARQLPPSVMRLMRSTHDATTTPFVERLADVRRIFLALPEPLNVAYAIGALGGLRTGEVFALRWQYVDLAKRRIHVRESVKGPLKDDKPRLVPIQDALVPVLQAWHLKTGGVGRVIPTMRRDGQMVDKGTPGPHLRRVLEQLGLARPGLGWYEATRHTFASHWVLAGNSIEKLSKMLGHYSVLMTERYAHLRPDLFTRGDLATIAVDLGASSAEPGRIPTDKPTSTIGATEVPENAGKGSEPSCKPGIGSPVPPDLAARTNGVTDTPLGGALPQSDRAVGARAACEIPSNSHALAKASSASRVKGGVP